MTVLFQREVPLRSIVAVEPQEARALGSPIRLAMLDLLAQRPATVESLGVELRAHGFRKAPNTLRHHLDILVRAGLVDLAVLEQTRGAVLKHFAAAARPLHYHLSPESEADLGALTERLRTTVARAMTDLTTSEAETVRRVAHQLRPCPRCSTEHFEEFVLLSALHRACLAFLREDHRSDVGKKTARGARTGRHRQRRGP